LVAVFAYILFLVGLNLAGLFTVGESVAGSGEGLARRGGAGGAFFTGVLAVVVAAPCIGPLLAAPMGAALLAPAPVGLAIFAMLALGMAAPFIALSFTPALGRYLPAPGPWMRIFKQILAFPVFAAAVYFIWVLAQQTGANAVGAVLGGAVLLSLAAWMFENSKASKPRAAIIMRVAAALLAAAALVPLTRIAPAEAAPKGAGAYGKIDAVAYDAQLLNQYRDAQTPVFIDFTAAWCVTCQFNKLTVLNSPEIAEAFARTGTVLMVADWTVRDPAITKALESFGAPGVPLYVYYGPSGEATILPQALSKKAVLEALLGAGES
jgi:thiol:disulfide interchange protein DsbD